MKIAIISDIHGNMEALNAVLNNIEQENCEKIFCLGDLAMAGPEPSITVQKIKEMSKDDNFILIQGNTDKMLSNYDEKIHKKLSELNETMANAYIADIKELSDDNKNFLRNLKESYEFQIGKITMLLVHGSPRKNDENIYPNLKIEEIENIIKSTKADIIFCGHTHIPCGYQTNTKQTVVNVSSVGRPFTQNPQSSYAIIYVNENNNTFEIQHKLVKYNIEKACEKLLKRDFKGCEKLANMLRNPITRYPQ